MHYVISPLCYVCVCVIVTESCVWKARVVNHESCRSFFVKCVNLLHSEHYKDAQPDVEGHRKYVPD